LLVGIHRVIKSPILKFLENFLLINKFISYCLIFIIAGWEENLSIVKT